ncbi:MAG: transcriptional regulator [Chlorobiales bacterium]|nr:transcriptional regulator [Chlorobiales bacterium]
MSIDRPDEYLHGILNELRKLPKETEWLEFKHNNADPDEIGEYLSALANSAALLGKVTAWLVWGVDNHSHDIIGTDFNPRLAKVHSQELESWLLQLLTPKINFRFHSLHVDEKPVVMLEIGAAFRHPVQFKNIEFIRIGSYKKKLKDYPEKERELWRFFDRTPFEREIAAEDITVEAVLKHLDYPAYFTLLNLTLPEGREGIIGALAAEELIVPGFSGKWNITNLGAMLFARQLSDFRPVKRKAIRVVLYKGEDRVITVREQEGVKGYACGFEGLIAFITNLLPSNEVIGQALRKEVPMFPELAIRELVANAIIHQDFHVTGTAPMVEIFASRMEITNPGLPLVKIDRFLDSPPKSRNEELASFMRRIGICEERGSGIDKVVSQTEFYQLPAPIFETTDEHTRTVLFAHRELKEMDKADRVRACYLHACLKYVQRDFMTNTSLRERFGIEEKNRAMVSRIIADTRDEKLIRSFDESVGSKAKKYIPWWA